MTGAAIRVRVRAGRVGGNPIFYRIEKLTIDVTNCVLVFLSISIILVNVEYIIGVKCQEPSIFYPTEILLDLDGYLFIVDKNNARIAGSEPNDEILSLIENL
jgi:hypothetical protein